MGTKKRVKKMGRPPLPKGKVKAAVLGIRLRRGEMARIRRAARRAGLEPGAWARGILLEAADDGV
jgi:hypothetical protein